MKRIVAWMLAALLCMGMFSLFACTPTTDRETESASSSAEETQKPVESGSDSPEPSHTHEYEVRESQSPTCIAAGYVEYGCKNCEHSYRDELAATGVHTPAGNTLVNADGGKTVWCSDCDQRVAVTEEYAAMVKAVEDSIEAQQLMIASYGDVSDDEDIALEQMKLLKEAGLNTVIANGAEKSMPCSQYLEAIEEYDMMIIPHFNITNESDPQTVANQMQKLARTIGAERIAGVYLRDEPYPFWFGNIGAAAQALRETLGEKAENWLIAPNMLPYGNEAFAWDGAWSGDYSKYGELNENGALVFKDGMKVDAMENAMNLYAEYVHANALWFDMYPFGNGTKSDNLPTYLVNLVFYQKHALKMGVPLGTFLQTSPVGDRLDLYPSFEQVRCEMNMSLAGGASQFMCFLALEAGVWPAMVNSQAERGPLYDHVKKAATGILSMKGVYLDYAEDRYILKNADRYVSQLTEERLDDLLVESYGELTAVETEGEILVGCSKNSEGKTGLYVVNLNWTAGNVSEVTLKLNQEVSYQLWGDTDGLEAVGSTDVLHLTLEAGAGFFIALDVD